MSDVLAVAEHRDGDLRTVSHELLTAGRDVTAATGGDLYAAVIGSDVESLAADLNRKDVDVVHTAEDGEAFNHDVYTQVVTQLVEEIAPSVVLIPHTANGIDYAPAVATDLGYPLLTDAIDLQADGRLEVTREEYNSKVKTVLAVADQRALVTVRPGEWEPADGAGDARIEPFEAEIDDSAIRTAVTGYEETIGGDVDIGAADFVVSIGRGIEDEENIELIEELCDVTGATLGASRPVCDNGWLPKNRQVGQSGNDISPDVYVAIGISGAVQHVAGMKNSETIIAINEDPSAPIFNVADYGIVDDLFDVVPELIEAFADA